MSKNLSTEPYKGTRDFYPKDMAVERYIFDTWARTAESFGYERYDASLLEPAELYRSKSSEEIVNEQTYTFVDRGDREVTLRPEMTPTVARMVAARRRELSFPVRWYSIPNLFRYERPQRGRLREHWQLNCDLFGIDDFSADVEVISTAYRVLTAFGATPDTFEIRLNDRALLNEIFASAGLSESQSAAFLALLDRKEKMPAADFEKEAQSIAGKMIPLPSAFPEGSNLARIVDGLAKLKITNVVFSPSTVRGFTYYTGTIFEIFDTSTENNRSLLGGGRYDNLTNVFGGDPIPGIGFGMGDVTMRDFLTTHDLIPSDVHVTAPTLAILPTEPAFNIDAECVAETFREHGVMTTVDLGTKKLGKKIASAGDAGTSFALVVGSEELASGRFTLKELATRAEFVGSITELANQIT